MKAIKKLLQKFILVCGVVAIIAPVRAVPLNEMTYLDFKFVEALKQGDIMQVDKCLEDGANVNVILDGGKTPLIQIVDDIATSGKDSFDFFKKAQEEMFYGLCIIPGVIGFGLGVKRTNEEMDRASLAHTTYLLLALIGITTVAYGIWKNVRGEIFNFGSILYLERMNVKLRILSLLLKHPALDLTIKNSGGKTVFDTVDAYLKEAAITNEVFFQKRQKIKCFLEPMQKVEGLLKAKVLATGKGA